MKMANKLSLESPTELIILKNFHMRDCCIFFEFNTTNFNAWLENANKHVPEVYSLKKHQNGFYFDLNKYNSKLLHSKLKLSISRDGKRSSYSVYSNLNKILNSPFHHFNFDISGSHLTIDMIVHQNSNEIEKLNSIIEERNKLNLDFKKREIGLPAHTSVMGSCFTRSVFNSSDYFNPEYKSYFKIMDTFFHNSLISMTSWPYSEAAYKSLEDLQRVEFIEYVRIEFKKNLREILEERPIQFLLVDNYSDAALPVVQMNQNTYFTYSRYFSESIFRKEFSDKEIVLPGSDKHLDLYNKSLMRLKGTLSKFQLDKKIILIGGRLCYQKNETEIWQEKLPWITQVNTSWDKLDLAFLEHFPDTSYIDMRSTDWISDPSSPIKGGASPAHFQSGFYKQIFKNLIEILFSE